MTSPSSHTTRVRVRSSYRISRSVGCAEAETDLWISTHGPRIKFSHLFANKFGYVLTSRKMCLKNFNSASWKKKEGFKILCFHALASLSLCLKDFCNKGVLKDY
ncbi:hypothetical protein DVH24_040205 [Malus domestica]|uniref:Uncharacterized protein n=1 Tax=Malus domestica TaxID=3750 RepID=A0A498I5P3_MALDO|nr:hypothetical protein DVH24_040205 [Malus domestica]